MRLKATDLRQVIRRHIFDANVRLLFAIQAYRLQAIEGLAFPCLPRQLPIADQVRPKGMNTEKWRLGDFRLQRDERFPRRLPTLATDNVGKLRDRGGLEQGSQR